jgi:hypothetical protein
MLRIREEQMVALGKRTQARFLAMMEAYLRQHFTRWIAALSDADLRGWLAHALDTAARHGVTTEPEAAQLILLFLVLGVDAEERLPWARDVLSARHLAPVGKVKKLIVLAREHRTAGIEHVVTYPGMEA